MKANDRTGHGLNLLRVAPVRAVFLSPLFPYVIQVAILVLFVGLAVFGWGLFAPEGVASKQYAKTNIVNLLIWGVWWPAMIWGAVFFGRSWCAVCPLELVSNVTERLGRRTGIKQRTLSRALYSGVVILFFYAVIQLLVAGAQLHRVPAYTSTFLWTLLGLAAVVGFLYRDRAFCRGFCPVGLLLSAYGRGSLVAVRSLDADVCEQCPEQNCKSQEFRDRLDARSCPSLLDPTTLADNADCLMCGQCAKACPSANVGLVLRSPFSAADRRPLMATWPLALFVTLVSGFVIYESFSEWKAAQALFLWMPETVAAAMGFDAHNGWVKGVWMLFVVPAVLWSALSGLVVLFRGAKSMGEAWRRLALPLAVVIAAAHMAKGLAKVTSWGVYLPMAFDEPKGADSALAITAKTLDKPHAALSLTVVSVISLLLVLSMGYFGLRESRLADAETHKGRTPAILLVTCGLAFLIFGWGSLQ